MVEIIGLLGHQGVGKNYLAEKILPKILPQKNTVVLAFADHFKIECISKFGAEYDKVFGKKDFDTRKLLQRVGSEEGRDKYGTDIWIKHLHNWIKVLSSRGVERFIISDVRFENEAKWVKSINGKIIKINAPSRYRQRLENETNGNEEKIQELMNHSSEKNIDNIDIFDFLVNNDFNDDVESQLNKLLGIKKEVQIVNKSKLSDNTFYGIIILLMYSLYDVIPKTNNVIITTLFLITYGLGLLFYYFDSHIGWWSKYKRIHNRKQKIDLFIALPQVFINDFFLILNYFYFYIPYANNRGLNVSETPPSLLHFSIDMFMYYLIYDAFFYCFHYFIHNKYLYSFIHKKHHETYADCGITTHYMGTIDFFLELIIPYQLAIFIWNGNWFSSLCFAVLGQINGVVTHSGYNFPGLPIPDTHQDHHLLLNGNYGVGGPWDWVFGTQLKND